MCHSLRGWCAFVAVGRGPVIFFATAVTYFCPLYRPALAWFNVPLKCVCNCVCVFPFCPSPLNCRAGCTARRNHSRTSAAQA